MRPSLIQNVIVGAIILVALGACAVPFVSEREVEIESEQQFDDMRNSMPTATDVKVRAYVFCVADAIIAQLEEPYASMDWDIEVFDDEAVNAFAMPGGKIGVFTGILKVADNQDELGAVIGHEVAHVTQHHSVERVNQAMTTQVGASAVGAILGGGYAGSAVQMAADLGLTLPYGRGQESEADTVGLIYSADAGFDPRASIELWKKMDKANDGAPPEFLSTHPSSSSRISDLVAELPVALERYNAARAAGHTPHCAP